MPVWIHTIIKKIILFWKHDTLLAKEDMLEHSIFLIFYFLAYMSNFVLLTIRFAFECYAPLYEEFAFGMSCALRMLYLQHQGHKETPK